MVALSSRARKNYFISINNQLRFQDSKIHVHAIVVDMPEDMQYAADPEQNKDLAQKGFPLPLLDEQDKEAK